MAAMNASAAFRHLFSDAIIGIVKFPFWWYTRGLVEVSGMLRSGLAGAARTTAVGIWIKNIFVPMYGETSWQGRLISVFMRIVMIIARGAWYLAWAALLFALFGLYAIVLPLAVIGIFYHAGGMILS